MVVGGVEVEVSLRSDTFLPQLSPPYIVARFRYTERSFPAGTHAALKLNAPDSFLCIQSCPFFNFFED